MAYDLNSVILVGRMTKDIELRTSNAGKPFGKFTIASNEGNDSSFFDCTAFGKTAEVLSQYAGKGKQIIVTGKLKQEQWQDKQSGQSRSKVVITVNSVQLLGGKVDGGNQQPQAPQDGQSPYGFSNNNQNLNDDMPF